MSDWGFCLHVAPHDWQDDRLSRVSSISRFEFECKAWGKILQLVHALYVTIPGLQNIKFVKFSQVKMIFMQKESMTGSSIVKTISFWSGFEKNLIFVAHLWTLPKRACSGRPYDLLLTFHATRVLFSVRLRTSFFTFVVLKSNFFIWQLKTCPHTKFSVKRFSLMHCQQGRSKSCEGLYEYKDKNLG